MGLSLIPEITAGESLITMLIALSRPEKPETSSVNLQKPTCVWAAYSSGLNGLLATLPEYMIGAAISLPLLKKVSDGARDEPSIEGEEPAEDMVGTMALAYQKDFSGSVDRLDAALSSLAEVVGKYNSSSVRLSEEEYREILTKASKKACVSCNAATECTKAGIRPIIKNTDAVVRLLCEGIKIDPAILCIDGERCAMADELAVEINREVGHREQERYLKSGIGGVADEYSLTSAAPHTSEYSTPSLSDKRIPYNCEQIYTLPSIIRQVPW